MASFPHVLQQYVNPIPTSQGRNQPLYERHVTKSGRNRVKLSWSFQKILYYLRSYNPLCKCLGCSCLFLILNFFKVP